MDSINVNGVSFRWMESQLLITTAHGQDLLSAGSAAQLLDFLLMHQLEMDVTEPIHELPAWARDERGSVTGSVEHQAPCLEEP